jgi:hypothetical protein
MVVVTAVVKVLVTVVTVLQLGTVVVIVVENGDVQVRKG